MKLKLQHKNENCNHYNKTTDSNEVIQNNKLFINIISIKHILHSKIKCIIKILFFGSFLLSYRFNPKKFWISKPKYDTKWK